MRHHVIADWLKEYKYKNYSICIKWKCAFGSNIDI